MAVTLTSLLEIYVQCDWYSLPSHKMIRRSYLITYVTVGAITTAVTWHTWQTLWQPPVPISTLVTQLPQNIVISTNTRAKESVAGSKGTIRVAITCCIKWCTLMTLILCQSGRIYMYILWCMPEIALCMYMYELIVCDIHIVIRLTCAGYSRGRVSIVLRQAEFTLKACCVIEAVEAFPSDSITCWSQSWIHIPITLARNALTNLHTISGVNWSNAVYMQ